MRTEHYLLHVLGVTSETKVKFVDSKGLSSPSSSDFDIFLAL